MILKTKIKRKGEINCFAHYLPPEKIEQNLTDTVVQEPRVIEKQLYLTKLTVDLLYKYSNEIVFCDKPHSFNIQ